MRKANGQHHEFTAADFEAVRATGASEAEIVEAFGVMETFVAFNRFLDAVDVAMD